MQICPLNQTSCADVLYVSGFIPPGICHNCFNMVGQIYLALYGILLVALYEVTNILNESILVLDGHIAVS